MNARQNFQLNPVAFLIATTFAFACTNASALDVKPGFGLGDFEDGEHQFVGDELKEDLNIYGDFSNKTHEFTIHTANGTLHLSPIDKKEERVLFVSNNSYFNSGKPIPQLTIEGGVTIGSFIAKNTQTTLQADKYKNLSTFAVIQAGSDTSGINDKTSGKIYIQGDLNINNVSAVNASGETKPYSGNAIYVGQESVLDLTKKDGTLGNIHINNSNFSGSVIDIGGSGYDSSAMGATFKSGDINFLDTNGYHGISVFGGAFKAGTVTITGGTYSHDLISFTGHKQKGDDNLKTSVETGDIVISGSNIKGSAIYVGTSGPNTSPTGTVAANLGNIVIDNVEALVSDGQGFIHFKNNENTNIQLGDVTVTNSTIKKHVASEGSAGIRFTNNQDVTLKGNGSITFDSINIIQDGDPTTTSFWSDQISLVHLEHSVNNLNNVSIKNLTNDQSKQGSNPNTSPYLAALHLNFNGQQTIGHIDINGVITHKDGVVYGVYQNKPKTGKNTLLTDSISVQKVTGENDAYGLYLAGELTVGQTLGVSNITGSNQEDRLAYGVLAKDAISVNQSTINSITGWKATGLEAQKNITSTGTLTATNIKGISEATGVFLKQGGTLTDVGVQDVDAITAIGFETNNTAKMSCLTVNNINGLDKATGSYWKGKSDVSNMLHIQNVSAENSSSTAIGVEIGSPFFGTYSLTAKDAIILNIKGGSKAYGVLADSEKSSFMSDSLSVTNVSASDLAVGIATHEANIKNLSIDSIAAKNAVALLVLKHDSNSNGVSVNEDGTGTVKIDGNILVDDRQDKATNLALQLTNKNSYLKGAIGFTSTDDALLEDRMTTTAQSRIQVKNGASWFVTDNSYVTDLTVDNKGTLDLVSERKDRWHKVTTNHLAGENGALNLGINLGTESVDNVHVTQLEVKEKAEGKFTANLSIDGRHMAADKFHSENWLISQGATDSNMNIEGSNKYSGRGMVTTWGLAFVANGEEDKLDTAEGLAQLVGNTTGKGEGKWYLVRNDEEIVDPTPDPDPKPEQPGPNDPAEMQQITNLGISATQALSFASELEDLRGRLGEVRYGAQDGAWVRAGYAKETADGYNGRGFEQKTHDLHIGLDRIVAADEDSSWLVGGALRYAKSKQEGFTAARGGEGELEQYSAKLYATYMHAQGSYADFVVQAGRYSQDLTGLANDLSSAFKADYKTYGYGASVEIGHMFDFNNQVDDRQWFNHFFIEPQLQLSYFNAHGKDYKTSTGLAVSQSDADFLTGRAGVVLGKKFNYGTADDLDKRYFQVGLKGGVKYEFLGDQTIRFTGVERVTKERKADDVEGARYYYGVTADWQLSNNFRAYATVEREESDHYTKDFDVSVGLKYQF